MKKATSNPPEPGAHMMRPQVPGESPAEYSRLEGKSKARFSRTSRAKAVKGAFKKRQLRGAMEAEG